MRTLRLGPRDRRALLLGAAVLAPALFAVFGVRPYLAALEAARGRLESERSLLERELALLADARAFPEVLRAAEATLEREAPRLFAGPDLLAATGALQGYLAGRATESRLFIQQSEAVRPDSAGVGIGAVRVALRAVGDLAGVVAFLHALEAGPQLVRVERLAIERARRVGAAGEVDELVLSISATVAGYTLLEPEDVDGGAPWAPGGRP